MPKSTRTAIFCLLTGLAVCGVGGWVILAIPAHRAQARLQLQIAEARSAHAHLEQEIAEARKVGMPIVVGDLHEPKIDPAQDAAPIYRKMEDLLRKIEDKTRSNEPPGLPGGPVGPGMGPPGGPGGPGADEDGGKPPKQPTPTQLLAQQDQQTDALKPVFDLLPELDAHPFVTAPALDVNANLLDGLPSHILLRQICNAADLADRRSDAKSALRFMRYAARAANDAGASRSEIGIISELVQKLDVFRQLETIVERHPQDRAFLMAVQDLLPQCLKLPDFRRDLTGEVVLQMQSVSTLTEFPKDLTDGKESDDNSSDDGPKSAQEQAEAAAQKAYIQSPTVQDELHARLLAGWRSAWVHLPSAPDDWKGFDKALGDVAQTQATDRSQLNSVNREVLNADVIPPELANMMQAHARLLQVSLMLLQRRLDSGSLPPTLPKDLGNLGIDPFDGKPLKYRRKGTGFILYSVGRDGKDDGGHKRNPKDPPGTGYDEVVEFT